MIACIIAAIENQTDREFMEALYLENYALMYQKARSLLGSHHEAEDAVETAMLKLIDRIDLLRQCKAGSRRAYLLSCVRNAAIDSLRRQKKGYSFDDVNEKLERMPDDTAVDEGLIRQAQIHSVACALKRLPPRERELLKMKYFDEMPDAEIAALIGVSRDGLRNRINRARRKLAALLQEVEGENG